MEKINCIFLPFRSNNNQKCNHCINKRKLEIAQYPSQGFPAAHNVEIAV
jgi:hypothetical protein